MRLDKRGVTKWAYENLPDGYVLRCDCRRGKYHTVRCSEEILAWVTKYRLERPARLALEAKLDAEFRAAQATRRAQEAAEAETRIAAEEVAKLAAENQAAFERDMKKAIRAYIASRPAPRLASRCELSAVSAAWMTQLTAPRYPPIEPISRYRLTRYLNP